MGPAFVRHRSRPKQLLATEWARSTIEWSLSASLAEAYFGLAAVDRQIEISETVLGLRRTTVELPQKEFSVGTGNEFELRRAQEKGGVTRRDALIDACSKRARPILMTTVAMGAGMLPIALKIGADADFRAPMAIAVIGGLITSTLLSLFYVPVVFTYVDDLKNGLTRASRPPTCKRGPHEQRNAHRLVVHPHRRGRHRARRRLAFEVEAHDGVDLISERTHGRCLIDARRFSDKVAAKLRT